MNKEDYIHIAIMIVAVVAIIWVGIIVIEKVSAETTFCKGKEGIHVLYRDTSKTYLNCSEMQLDPNGTTYN